MRTVNALRKELQILMQTKRTSRPPVLRRSLVEEWLYATDLPGVCSREEISLFQDQLTENGWEYTADGQWILMRKTAEEPPDEWYNGSFSTEAGCCLSLLERHPDRTTDAPEAAQRMLIKAGEEGEKRYEAACAALHRNWAERLRKGEPLPALNSCYFLERKE